MPLGSVVDMGAGHIVLDGDPAPPPESGTAAYLFSVPVETKRSPISPSGLFCTYIGGVVYNDSFKIQLPLFYNIGRTQVDAIILLNSVCR